MDTTPNMHNCRICGQPCDCYAVEAGGRCRLCNDCWYGMRFEPDEWRRRLAESGIQVERRQGGGCSFPGGGIVCSNPYDRIDSPGPPEVPLSDRTRRGFNVAARRMQEHLAMMAEMRACILHFIHQQQQQPPSPCLGQRILAAIKRLFR